MQKEEPTSIMIAPVWAITTTILFTIFKVTGLVSWSWLAVFLPMILFIGFFIAFLIGLIILSILID